MPSNSKEQEGSAKALMTLSTCIVVIFTIWEFPSASTHHKETLTQETVSTARSGNTNKESNTLFIISYRDNNQLDISTLSPHPTCHHVDHNCHHVTVE